MDGYEYAGTGGREVMLHGRPFTGLNPRRRVRRTHPSPVPLVPFRTVKIDFRLGPRLVKGGEVTIVDLVSVSEGRPEGRS